MQARYTQPTHDTKEDKNITQAAGLLLEKPEGRKHSNNDMIL